MGSGKSVMTLTAFETLLMTGQETQPALVLAPLRVAKDTWSDEAAKWEHLRNIDVSQIVGDKAERIAALKKDASVYTMNYENLPWLYEHLNGNFHFGTVISDESTRVKSLRISEQVSKKGVGFLKGQGSIRAKRLAQMTYKKVRRWLNLTGTPSPNGLLDLWGQTWFLDHGERLGKSYSQFESRWFQQIPTGGNFTRVKPLPHAQREIQEVLNDICLTIDIKDYYDIGEFVDCTVHVTLPKKAKRIYEQVYRELFVELQSGEVEAPSQSTKLLKCLQIASGAVYLTEQEGKWEEVHDEKIQALESIFEEAAGMPIIVAYHFKSDLERLLKAFPSSRKFDKNPQTKKDFIDGKIPMLLMHPKSAAHGVDGLQIASNIIVFFSQNHDLEDYEQISERIGPTRQFQVGLNRPVFRYHIVAKDTVEELVVESLRSKVSVQELLKNSMKRGDEHGGST